METAEKNGGHAANAASKDRFQRLKALLETDPGNPRLVRDCIEAALQAAHYDFVLEHTQKTPSDVPGLFDRASALIGKREYSSAIDSLNAVLAQQPQLSAARINLGFCYYMLEQYAEARTELDVAYAAGDRSAGSLRLLISSYHHLGLVEEAVKIAAQNPDPAESDAALAGVYALLYLDADNAPAAARWAGRALAGNARSLDGLVVQGTLDVLNMDTAGAKSRFEQALEIAPTTGRAWVGLGTLALLAHDFGAAKQQLRKGLEHMPAHVGSWHVLGWTHLLAGELDAAEAALQHALELDRNFAESHGGIAAIAALRGRHVEAERGIETALRLDPKCLSAQFARSVLTGHGGDPAEARRIIRDTAAGLLPDDSSVLSTLIQRATRH